ncbi:winged helix-turn-helix domain-containing protein [Dyella tabacisoli]|uniref:Winged helix-turn-helix domain-containing protein n=1 Tax=Dyella tabacisoli TaxID=2282381 RepID=A0A369UU65_9GAMM|nr:winged helix-turn-helix domain-containing protein [Dyella tabacisoli]
MLRLSQARCLQLAAQGLLKRSSRRARSVDVVAAIERMRLLQIDSIHVVARSPYLVLYSRLGAYEPNWLDDALAQGKLAETWAHEACFVCAADYALHQAWREQRAPHWAHRHAQRVQMEHRQSMDNLLVRIRDTGPVRAADFAREETTRGASGWWEWKPEKRWLEACFALGELMVTRRERFQRVYDLSANVLARLDPPLDATQATLSHVELRRRFILDSVRALGISQARWIADYYRLKPAVTAKELAPLVSHGELVEVTVEGWDAPGYVHCDHAELLAQASLGRLRATHTTLLSPFDPLVWDRARVLAMFGFEYTIECYTPSSKRRYGYYVLPILHRGRLIGRLDAKAHRAQGEFEIKAMYLEPDIEPTTRLLQDLAGAVADMAHWHGTPRIRLGRCRPAGIAAALRALWRG